MTAILTKTTESGRTLYFSGTIVLQRAAGPNGEARTVAVGESGLLLGDAYRFESCEQAEYWGGVLNDDGIGGSPWLVMLVADEVA